MEIPFVDLKAQYQSIKPDIDHAIQQVLNHTAFVGGEWLAAFEKNFAAFVQVPFCVSCANGTDAIEIALEALGIGANDEVLVPAYTWVSTASAVSRVGATPVLVDVHPQYYTLDEQQIESKITAKTKAIIPVHFYGLPANMPAIMAIAKAHNLRVIEDCAQAHGATINGQPVGSFGDMATFSFYPGKNLGAYGDGGAVCTSDATYAEKARTIARLGQQGKHNHVAIGRNSRLDTLQAAILDVKLRHLPTWTAQRQQVAQAYEQGLVSLPVQLPGKPTGFEHVYHLYVIQTPERDALQDFLKEQGVQTQIHYPKPLHALGIFKQVSEYPVADAMAPKLLSLPMYAELTNAQIAYIVQAICTFFSRQ